MKIKRLGIFANFGKEDVRYCMKDFLNLCREVNFLPILPQEYAESYHCEAYSLADADSLRQLDYGVSLGGDGTLLQMAHYLVPIAVPAFGINFGKLGFLAEIDAQSIRKALVRLAAGNFTIEKRSLLAAEVRDNGNLIAEGLALNDFVLSRGPLGKLAHMQLYINGKLSSTLAADGLIVATATGSTAYSLSAGGPLVQPELDVIVISPICAHSLTARTLIIPMSEVINLTPLKDCEAMILVADGVNIACVSENSSIHIYKSDFSMQFIKLTQRDYYQTWQSKLMRNI